jgi:hypothetical protein
VKGLFERLEVQERLDEMIGRSIKRFMLLKGAKSVIAASSVQLTRLAKPKGSDQEAT